MKKKPTTRGYYLESGEKARLERKRKFQESVSYNNPITPEGRRRLEIFSYNLGAIRRLIRFGFHNFDDKGQILVQNDVTLVKEHISGKIFLEDIISYFEQKDKPYAYIYCAKAKALLDDYNIKFGHP